MAASEQVPQGLDLQEPVRACTRTDLLSDGSFGSEWLVVGEKTVYVFSEGDGVPQKRLEIPLDEIESAKAEPVIGGGVLDVECDGRTVELVRYTNAGAKKVASIARALEKWCKGEEAQVEEIEENRCPRCGIPLEEGTKVCPACLPKRKTLLRLVSYLWPFKKYAACLTLITLVSTAISLVPPYLNRPIINRVLGSDGAARPLSSRLSLLVVLVIVLSMSLVLGGVLQVARGWLSAWLGNKIIHNIRLQLYSHLNFLSLSFYDRQPIGALISRVNQDTGRLHQFLVFGSQELITNLLLILGIPIVLFCINWRLTLLVLLPAPVVSVLTSTIWRRLRRYMHRVFHRWSKLNALLTETLSGHKVVKAFAQENHEIERFSSRSSDLADMAISLERTWSVFFSGIFVLMSAGTILVWYVGGRDVIFNRMLLGDLIAYLALVGFFYRPVRSMSMLINWLSRSLAGAERVFEILNTHAQIADAEDAVPLPDIKGKVEFRNVSFGYVANKPVLEDMDLDVKVGEMIGLVGHSGAGKTTTINLIIRFYDVDEGEILVDDIPVRKIRLSDLRSQIGIVPQDTFLFSGTIAENIAYAKAGAEREDIVRAAKIANAHDFIIRKPDGYDSMVGEGGKGISAGERQRIAIARAVLHDPRILILDEATSQVDVETEKEIQEAIARLVKGRTTFAIAHRLSTLKNSDRLVILKQGKIAEIGTHDELMEKKGEFCRLVKMYQEVSKVRAVER